MRAWIVLYAVAATFVGIAVAVVLPVEKPAATSLVHVDTSKGITWSAPVSQNGEVTLIPQLHAEGMKRYLVEPMPVQAMEPRQAGTAEDAVAMRSSQ